MSHHNKHNIDDLYKNAFKHLPVEIPREAELWQRIAEQKKSKNKRRIWWIFLALGLFVITIISGVVYKSNDRMLQKEAAKTEVAETSIAQNLTNTLEKNTSIRNKSLANQKQSKNEKHSKASNLKNTSSPTYNDSQPAQEKQKSVQRKSSATLSETAVGFSAKQKAIAYAPMVNQKKSGITKESFDKTQNDLEISKAAYIESMSALPMLSLIPMLTKPSTIMQQIPNEKLAMIKNKKAVHSLTLASGVNSVLNKVEINNTAAPEFQSFEALFKPLSSFNTSIAYGYRRGNIKFSIGLEWQHLEIQHENTYFSEGQRVLQTNPQAYVLLEGNNPPVYFEAESYGSTSFMIHELSSVTSQSLLLPLKFCYLSRLGNRFRIGPSAGVIVNLHKNYTGKTLTEDGIIRWVDNDNRSPYLNNALGIQLLAGIECELSIKGPLSLSLHPVFRYNFQDFFKNNYSVNNYHHLFGGQIGLTYKIPEK